MPNPLPFTNRALIDAWSRLESVIEIAAVLGVRATQVTDAARRLRKKGIALRSLRRVAPDERRVAVWNAATTIEEFAREEGFQSAARASFWASRMRRQKGFTLKKFRTGRLDIERNAFLMRLDSAEYQFLRGEADRRRTSMRQVVEDALGIYRRMMKEQGS